MAKVIKMDHAARKDKIRARITKHVAKTKAEQLKKSIVSDFSLDKPELTDADKLLLAQIAEQEEKCLKTIHSRFCLVKMVPISIGDVERFVPDKNLRQNYWEYWYKAGKPDQAFLMSREVIIEDGKVKLNILFNKDLMREGEE